MRSLRTLGRAIKVTHKRVGLKRFLELADPFCGRQIDRIEPSDQRFSIVVLAPHPDDESIGCGGAIALHRKRGDDVQIIYTTDGGKPPRGATKNARIIETRIEEARRAAEILGGATIHELHLPDGKGAITDEAVASLSAMLNASRPDRIYVPWRLDGHPDHEAANALLVRSIKKADLPRGCAVWQYEVWTPLVPNRYVPIADVLKRKEQAIAAHVSQTDRMNYVASSIGLAHFRGLQGGLEGPAEAYFAVPADKLVIFNEL